jgi:predicted dehydrogenase
MSDTLGAAVIGTGFGVLTHVRALDAAGIEVRALVGRDPDKTAKRAERFGIEHATTDRREALARDDVDIVAVTTPPHAHAAVVLDAVAAGKHVLCEKPFSATVAEAEAMADAAARSGRVLMEAFHYRYHALFARMRALLRAGEIGTVQRLEAWFFIPLLKRNDIRWRADLAGGALMDTGCYTVHLLRHLAEAEPDVVSARALWTRGGVDRWLTADLRFPGDRSARLTCSLLTSVPLRMSARVTGSGGTLRVFNPIAPQFFHRLRLDTPAARRVERVRGPASYDAQLIAFVGAVRRGEPIPTDPPDSIANMRVIEAIYAAAGRARG